MLNAANAGWAHLIGVLSLFGFVIAGFATLLPMMLAERDAGVSSR